MITTEVENYPGYPTGITGPEMMEEFRQQAERFGTAIHYEVINKVDFSGPVHKVWTDGGKEILADSVIIATGASAKWLGLPSEKKTGRIGLRGLRRLFLPRHGSGCGRRRRYGR